MATSSTAGGRLTRRSALLAASATGLGYALPGRAQLYEVENSPHDRTRGCSTPRSAIAKTQYGNVRGYVAGEVLHFKVPLIIGGVSEEGMQWSRNPTEPEWLASLAQALGEDKARRLVAAIAASVPKDDGRWRFVTY